MASAGAKMPKEGDDLKLRVTLLEDRVDYLEGVIERMSRVFSGAHFGPGEKDKDEIPFNKAKAIFTCIEKGGSLSAAQLANMEKYCDAAMYTDTEWFQRQIMIAFEKMIMKICGAACKQAFTFDEAKATIIEISKQDSNKAQIMKLLVQYI